MKFYTLSLTLILVAFISKSIPPDRFQEKNSFSILKNGKASWFRSSGSGQVLLQEMAPKKEVYKTVGDVKVYLYIFNPVNHQSTDKLPAIVFFHGGSWKAKPDAGPSSFKNQCEYLITRGMVAIDVQYRGLPEFTISDCISDTQSAIRWIRANAERLGIDPDRIAAGGGSAGGHLAASTATLPSVSENGEDTIISCVPDALVLFNPALTLAPVDYLPKHNIHPGLPPTIIFHGKDDNAVPFENVEKFAMAMRDAGNHCELIGFEGAGHGFFNWNATDHDDRRKFFVETLRGADQFLASLGWINGAPTINK
jgi:acetyl esterase/lipase